MHCLYSLTHWDPCNISVPSVGTGNFCHPPITAAVVQHTRSMQEQSRAYFGRVHRARLFPRLGVFTCQRLRRMTRRAGKLMPAASVDVAHRTQILPVR